MMIYRIAHTRRQTNKQTCIFILYSAASSRGKHKHKNSFHDISPNGYILYKIYSLCYFFLLSYFVHVALIYIFFLCFSLKLKKREKKNCLQWHSSLLAKNSSSSSSSSLMHNIWMCETTDLDANSLHIRKDQNLARMKIKTKRNDRKQRRPFNKYKTKRLSRKKFRQLVALVSNVETKCFAFALFDRSFVYLFYLIKKNYYHWWLKCSLNKSSKFLGAQVKI